MSFSGFTQEGLKFLFENKLNNNKDWYESHKSVYKKHIYNPFVELIMDLSPAMLEIDPQFITVPSKIISRVRRDTRFSKDKSLYRDNAWIVFLKDKSKMSSSPCFWFEITQKGSSYGLGYYGAQSSSMSKMREMILDGHPQFKSAQKFYESQDLFVIGGDMYKRSKFPDQTQNLKSWLDRKNIFFQCVQNDFSVAFSKDLPIILKTGFKALKPVYEFLCTVESYSL